MKSMNGSGSMSPSGFKEEIHPAILFDEDNAIVLMLDD